MTKSTRSYVPTLSTILIASSVNMLWLFWRYPVPTTIGTIALLATLLHFVRIAKFLDLAATFEPSAERAPTTLNCGLPSAASVLFLQEISPIDVDSPKPRPLGCAAERNGT